MNNFEKPEEKIGFLTLREMEASRQPVDFGEFKKSLEEHLKGKLEFDAKAAEEVVERAGYSPEQLRELAEMMNEYLEATRRENQEKYKKDRDLESELMEWNVDLGRRENDEEPPDFRFLRDYGNFFSYLANRIVKLVSESKK